ncbi:MAG: acyl carrier protein [Pseudobacteriovorax sp.]|nr:acyl carrier protein [Pseudobacteriovorax sp.]
MMKTDILSKLSLLSAETFGCDKIDVDNDIFQELGIDSYEALRLITLLEDEFKVEIPDFELNEARTLRELSKLIASYS